MYEFINFDNIPVSVLLAICWGLTVLSAFIVSFYWTHLSSQTKALNNLDPKVLTQLLSLEKANSSSIQNILEVLEQLVDSSSSNSSSSKAKDNKRK